MQHARSCALVKILRNVLPQPSLQYLTKRYIIIASAPSTKPVHLILHFTPFCVPAFIGFYSYTVLLLFISYLYFIYIYTIYLYICSIYLLSIYFLNVIITFCIYIYSHVHIQYSYRYTIMCTPYRKYLPPWMFFPFIAFINGIMVNTFFFWQIKKTKNNFSLSKWKQISTK